jgi:uncharacterized delta-60 repeat protein
MKKSTWIFGGLAVLFAVIYWPRNGASFKPQPPASSTPTAAVPARAPLLSVAAAQQGTLPKSPAPAPMQPATASSPAAPVAPSQPPTPLAPDAACTAFEQWARGFLDNPGTAPDLDEGRRLAAARREALALEIKANPRGALEHAIPFKLRRALPPELAPYLETVVAGRAELTVYMADARPGSNQQEPVLTLRYIKMLDSGRVYNAYVYGRRVAQMGQPNIPICGIAVGNSLALHEDPARELDADESAAAFASGRLASHTCALCGVTPTDLSLARVLDLGGNLLAVCSEFHAADLNTAFAQSEAVSRRAGLASPPPSASGNYSWTNPPPESPAATFGERRALYMRVVFPDDTQVQISKNEAEQVMKEVNDFYVEASYNKVSIISTVTPVLTLPQPKTFYAGAGIGAIAGDAATVATTAGFNAGNYDFIIIRHPNVPGFDWGGMGGGNGRGGNVWLQSSGAGVTIHELGHVFGLAHANYWETRRAPFPPNPSNLPFDVDSLVGHDSVIGVGDDIAYGDVFDVMGSGGGEYSPTGGQITGFSGHFNAFGKYILGWLPSGYIATYSSFTTNRIYVHDSPRLVEGRQYALRVRKDADREYWVSARGKYQDQPWLTNGVELHWAKWSEALGYSHLLDTTPGSIYGRDDAAIAIGRTYVDAESKVYITPTARGGSGTNTWFDVVVFSGVANNNSAPELELTASTNAVRRGGTVKLTATASDADGDALAYYWTVDDGTGGPNQSTVTLYTPDADTEVVVRCEVSDMKGGITIRHFVVTVGAPNTLRISGRVLDTFGQPIPNARVSNGALTEAPGYDYNTNYLWAYTDSNGEFTFVNVDPGAYYVCAYKEGYITKPLNFDTPITLVDNDAADVQLLATPRPIVTVQKVGDATAPSTAGQFKLTRTGDTNTALQAVFLMGGTARSGTHYTAWTNSVTHTNMAPNPFGAVEQVLPFFAADFPTGIVDLTIDIKPKPAATNGDEREVILTLMYPWQFMQTYLTNGDEGLLATNTNWISYSGWEIRSVNGADTWFQNYSDYLPAWPGEARLKIKNASSSGLPTVSTFALVPNTSENQYDAGLFTVVRSGSTASALVVPVVIGGTATPGSDYEIVRTNVVIPAGSSVASIPIIAREDFYLEGNETVTLTVLAQTNIYILNTGASSGTVTITDNDLPLVTIAATDNIATESAGDEGTIVITRMGDMTRPLVVNYLVSGDAVAGRDYRTLPGSVTIAAGQPSATVPVIGRDNGVKDGGHTVQVIVSDSPTYNIGPPSSTTVFIQDRALPTVTVATTVATAVEPGTAGEFTVTRSGDVTKELIVRYTVAGTAKPLGDYTSIGNKVRIAPGARTATIAVNPVNDTFREDQEYIVIELLPSTDYNVGSPYQASVNLNDEDSGSLPAVGFNFLSSSGFEAGGSTLIAISVSANPEQDKDVTVLYEVTGGTALLDVDYPIDARTGQVVFPHNPDDSPAGMATRTMIIALPINDNELAQSDRTIVLTLKEPPSWLSNWVTTNDVTITNGAGETITTNQVVTNQMFIGVPMNAHFDVYKTHTFTILDDDSSIVTVTTVDPTAKEEGLKPGIFRLHREGTVDRPQVVTFQLTGSASPGSDYQPIASTATIPAGATDLDIPVYPVDDPVQEYMEEVRLTLLTAPGATIGGDSVAAINIVDNDGTMEFTDTEYFALENVGQARIPIRRTGDVSGTSSVNFSVGILTGSLALTNSVATPDIDFIATNGTVTFGPGETVQYVPVTILDDTVVEPSESLTLTLVSQSDGSPIGGQTWATLTILDEDTSVEFTKANYLVNENATNAFITLRRIGLADKAVTVELTATNGTATNGFDFVATNRLVTFGATITNVTVQIRILDDVLIQTNQTILLSLATNAGSTCSVGPQTNAVLTIAEDDCTLDFAAATYNVNEFARTVDVNIQRLGGTVNAVTVDYATANGTALAGSDYVTARGTLAFTGDTNVLASDGSGTLVFQPGETNKTLELRILDDNVGEGNEAFTVALTNPRGPTRTPAGATLLGLQTNTVVTIVDDETPGSVDFAFSPGQGANAPVHAVAVQADGKTLIGGDFTAVDGIVLSRLARLHEDGYLDSFFNPGAGADADVLAITVQPDGRILVGGAFRFLDGQALNRYARLNADGSVDSDFEVGFGADGVVRAITVAPDGMIYLAGDFDSIDGITRPGIARVDNAGAIDSNFDPSPGIPGGVYSVALQADGKVLVAGSFTSAAGANYAYLARLNADGTPDKSFATGTGPDADVYSVAVSNDGHIIIGGAFTHFNAVKRAGIARLNADGSLDTTFDPGTGADATVYAVAVQSDAKVVLAGAFTNFAGQVMNRFTRVNPNGSIDSGFDIHLGANDTVRALALQANTAFVIGGDFTTVNGLDRQGVARIHGDEKFILSSIQFSAASYRIGEKGGDATITVQRSGDIQSVASVRFLTANGTAIAGSDYVATNGMLQFAAGQTDASFKVKILDDALAEGDETVLLLLTNLPAGYSPTGLHAATLTIEDNESAVAFTVATFTAVENAGKATITVRRSGPTAGAVSVDYATTDDSAIAGQDYQATSGTLNFAAGEVDKTFDVTLIDDSLGEPNKTVLLTLSNPVGGAVLGLQNTASLVIIDNDRVEFYSLNIATPIGGTVTPASGPYPVDSTQVLTATADRDFAFVGWEGTTNSSVNPLPIVMNRNYTLTAKFVPTTVTYTFEPPFTAGQLGTTPWYNSATAPWQLLYGGAAAGNYCLRSGPTGNGQDSTLEIIVDTRAGALSFDLRVSSEANWDFFEFYVNGTRLQRWSGDVAWQNYRFAIPAGRNSIAWRYVKDANFSAGLDAAFIDNLYIPLNAVDPTPAAAVLAVSSVGNGVLGVQLYGKSGLTYVLQDSTNLTAWTPVSTNVLQGTSTFIYVTPTAAKPIRYYRAVTP